MQETSRLEDEVKRERRPHLLDSEFLPDMETPGWGPDCLVALAE